MGSLQPSRATEFLADLGQGGGRAAAEPEAALRGLPPAAGGGPQRGADARLGAPSPDAPGLRGAGPACAAPAGVSLGRGGGSSRPMTPGACPLGPPALVPAAFRPLPAGLLPPVRRPRGLTSRQAVNLWSPLWAQLDGLEARLWVLFGLSFLRTLFSLIM